jgi:hypothetical protein
MARLLSMIAGAALGLFLGAYGCAAAMSIAGGGHSHNDMFTWAGSAIVGSIVGAVVVPLLTRKVLGMREQHIPFPAAIPLYLLGAALVAFLSGTLLYYSSAIAELPVSAGGPRSDFSGELRARASLAAGVVAGVSALFLLVKALRWKPRSSIG